MRDERREKRSTRVKGNEKMTNFIPPTFLEMGIRKVERELFKFKAFMDEIGEEFFLVAGLCLGLVRDGKLIEYDKDFDIGVMNEPSLYKIVEEAKLRGYYEIAHVTECEKGKICWLKKKIGNFVLPIEIIAHYRKDDYVYYNRDLGPTWRYREGRVVYDKRFFDVFEKVSFKGVKFNIPSPVKEYLTAFYGDDWREPKKYTDWRYNCKNLFEGWWL